MGDSHVRKPEGSLSGCLTGLIHRNKATMFPPRKQTIHRNRSGLVVGRGVRR